MNIEIFKFGGASVNSAEGVRNVADILRRYSGRNIVMVVSAMGKTTNALERLLHHYLRFDSIPMIEEYGNIRKYHFDILNKLFPQSSENDFPEVISIFEQLRGYLRKGHTVQDEMKDYNFEYDQIVSFGELISSEIVYTFLKRSGFDCSLIDVREVILTDSTFRNAGIRWNETSGAIRENISSKISTGGSVIITQGFIGSDINKNTTTLGREGSDYSAAIFAYSLSASEMTIWKDVPGVMNADPKWYPEAVKLDELSYREAIELAYFGASVIHPKTIKPLENANITLRVRSFREPADPGTVVRKLDSWKVTHPFFIKKLNQVLISISPKDFSFILEENLSSIFSILATHGIRVNMMQNSAISFSVCVDDDPALENCIAALQEDYMVKYNRQLELFTIRHYDADSISNISGNKEILLEQRTRNTIHLVTA